MLSARDCTRGAGCGRVTLGLVLGMALVSPGCASLRSPHQPPAATNDNPGARDSAKENSSSAGRLGQKDSPPAAKGPVATLAKRIKSRLNRSTEPEPGSIDLERPKPIAVALQPPTPLPPRRQPSQVAPASNPAVGTVRAAAAATPVTTLTGQTALAARRATSPSHTAPVSKPTMESLVVSARQQLDGVASYKVRMARQERVGTALFPAEEVELSVRRRPQAVRIEWPDGPHKGREVIYLADEQGGLMHINMADSVVPMPRMTLRPDSSLAMAQSRHPINEAGLETIVARLEKAIQVARRGDPNVGRVSYDGLVVPGGLDHPCHQLTQRKPDGEIWIVCLDPATKLPAFVQATDSQGNLLERYTFRDFKADPADLSVASAFDPDTRWGQSLGFLNRLAGSAASADPKTGGSLTR
jgi:hypothetical protein